jgi:hypothetical protein
LDLDIEPMDKKDVARQSTGKKMESIGTIVDELEEVVGRIRDIEGEDFIQLPSLRSFDFIFRTLNDDDNGGGRGQRGVGGGGRRQQVLGGCCLVGC